MEFITLFMVFFIWVFVLLVCFENMYLIIFKWYQDYKNNKQLKKDLKIKQEIIKMESKKQLKNYNKLMKNIHLEQKKDNKIKRYKK